MYMVPATRSKNILFLVGNSRCMKRLRPSNLLFILKCNCVVFVFLNTFIGQYGSVMSYCAIANVSFACIVSK